MKRPKNDGLPASEAQVSSPSSRERVLLESDVPVSRSLIWGLQRDFYAQRGLKSWTADMVPQFITNNPFIAEIYARIVFGFICDCIDPEEENSRRPSVQNPLRILELGAGVGKFAFLFLRHLEALLQSRNISLSTVRYCMTDCSDSLVQTWRAHKCFSDFLERGILQFELLDTSCEIAPRFLGVDPSQSSEQAYGPLVVIANYVFDSLPNDAFVIEGGQIFERLQTTAAACQDSGKTLPMDLSRLKFSYRDVEITSDHYPDPAWNGILDLYRRRLPAATVLFPSQVLTILHAISKFTNGTMLVLASDKGYVAEDGLLQSQGATTLEFHATNCFSQMVNFDAIAKYFEATGGVALLPDKHSSSLNLCAFLKGPTGARFLATKTSYQEARSNIGPDDLFALLGWLNPHMEEMSVPQILALLRFSRWDPTTLVRLFPVLARQIRTVSAERHDLRNAVMLTWANHFPTTPDENILAFYCGVILLELRFYEEAFSMLKRSQDLVGRSAATSYNLGLCSLGLGRSSEALALIVEACQLDPAFEPAQLLRRKLEDEHVTR